MIPWQWEDIAAASHLTRINQLQMQKAWWGQLIHQPLQHQGPVNSLRSYHCATTPCACLLLATESCAGHRRALLCHSSGHWTRQRSFPSLAPPVDAKLFTKPCLSQGSLTPPAPLTGFLLLKLMKGEACLSPPHTGLL